MHKVDCLHQTYLISGKFVEAQDEGFLHVQSVLTFEELYSLSPTSSLVSWTSPLLTASSASSSSAPTSSMSTLS